VGELSLWTAPALIAALLVLGVAIYLLVRWRRAPTAFRAMVTVAGICFVAGLLAGLWSFHPISTGTRGGMPSWPRSTSDSVPASEVGRAIVENDEKHAGDPMWMSSASSAELCDGGFEDLNSLMCRITYLARHAEGKDLDRGLHIETVSLADVAEICDEGSIDKSSDLCARAYAPRHAKMK